MSKLSLLKRENVKTSMFNYFIKVTAISLAALIVGCGYKPLVVDVEESIFKTNIDQDKQARSLSQISIENKAGDGETISTTLFSDSYIK